MHTIYPPNTTSKVYPQEGNNPSSAAYLKKLCGLQVKELQQYRTLVTLFSSCNNIMRSKMMLRRREKLETVNIFSM